MTYPNGGANTIWRDGDGGAYNPVKGEIRTWGSAVETAIDAVEVAVTDLSVRDGTAPNPKAAVAVATTANITLSGEQTLDGVLTSTSRVLVKNQTAPAENGIYVSAAGPWARATDMDADAEVDFASVLVEAGTVHGGQVWQTTASTITIGTGAMPWVLVDRALTAAEIKVAYESNADTNAFTDADKDRLALDFIENASPVPVSDFSVVDPDGNYVMSVAGDVATFSKVRMSEINGYPIADVLPVAALLAGMRSNIEGVLSYGQSNAIGTINQAAISTVDRYDNRRFSGGVRSQDSATPYTSFVPLTEQLSVNSGITYSETPISGSAEMMFELLESEDGIAFTDIDWQIFGAAPGQGSQNIAQLAEGTVYFDRVVADVQNAVTLANADGKSIKFRSVFWSQGETDQGSAETPAAIYGPRLVQIRRDLETAIQAETGQTEPVALITSQFNSHQSGGATRDPEIANITRVVCRDNQHMYMAGPWYPFQAATVLHPGVIEYKRIGAMYGLVQKRVLIDGVRWKPVEPIEQEAYRGKYVTVRFNVPAGRLVWDTTLLAEVASKGFSVLDSLGNPIIIDRADLIGPDTVSLACASDPTGGKVRYAWEDGGNLHDEQGDAIIFDGGAGYTDVRMHNWSVIFEEAL